MVTLLTIEQANDEWSILESRSLKLLKSASKTGSVSTNPNTVQTYQTYISTALKDCKELGKKLDHGKSYFE